MTEFAWLGIFGTVMGIVGVVFSIVTASRNNAKWGGIVEQKMNTVIDGLGKVETRLTKLEDDRADVRREQATLKSEVDALQRSVDRLHSRVDRINGGRDPNLQ